MINYEIITIPFDEEKKWSCAKSGALRKAEREIIKNEELKMNNEE